VEAYAAYALRAWLAGEHWISPRTRQFAKWSAIFSFALGMVGQVAYHLLTQAGQTRAPWAITTVVSCLPVLVLAMGTTLAHTLRGDTAAADSQPREHSAGSSRHGPRRTSPQTIQAGTGSRPWPGPGPRAGPRPGPEPASRRARPTRQRHLALPEIGPCHSGPAQ
jgi:hypothetical protein